MFLLADDCWKGLANKLLKAVFFYKLAVTCKSRLIAVTDCITLSYNNNISFIQYFLLNLRCCMIFNLLEEMLHTLDQGFSECGEPLGVRKPQLGGP